MEEPMKHCSILYYWSLRRVTIFRGMYRATEFKGCCVLTMASCTNEAFGQHGHGQHLVITMTMTADGVRSKCADLNVDAATMTMTSMMTLDGFCINIDFI
jgi:hypothetical protein